MTPEQSAAVARLNKFLHQRLHVRGFDQDEIVSLYLGDTERGAVLKASDVHALLAALDEAQADAARWRAVTTLKCNSLTLSRDDDHACNYVSASEWIDDHPEQFSAVSAEELQRMRDTNTIWALQVYPHTPIGSWVTYGATADAAIDAARAGEKP